MKNFKSIFSKGKKTKKHPSSETEIAKDSPGVDPTDSHKKYSNTLPQEVIEELKASKGGKTLPRRPTQPPVPNSRSGFVDMKTGSDFKRQSFSSVKETPAQAVETMPPKQAVEFAEVKGLQSLGCVDVSACDEFAESPAAARAYDAVPILEQTKLPRGGISVDTKAVGRVQVRLMIYKDLKTHVFIRLT